MTTIVGVQGDGWAVVGADSRASEGTRAYTMAPSLGKLVRRGRYVFASAGDVRAINVIAHVLKPPSPPASTGRKLDAFVSARLVPCIRETFAAAGYGGTSDSAFTVIVAVNAVIYTVGDDFAWLRDASGVYAHGTGGDLALGSLSSEGELTTLKQAKRAALRALNVAAKHDVYTAGPMVVKAQMYKLEAS